MVLTAENYYSKEANKEYMSVSQYRDFAGRVQERESGNLHSERRAESKL